MSEVSIAATLPQLPHPDFFKDPAHSIRSLCGEAILTYDPETRCGMIYRIAAGSWMISTAIDFAVFALIAAGSGYRIAEGEDSKRWIRTCDPHPAGANVVDFPGNTRH